MTPRVGELNATNPHTLTCTAREGPRVKERQTERQRHSQRQRDRKNEQEAFFSWAKVASSSSWVVQVCPATWGHKAAPTHERKCHIHETPVGT